MIKMLAPFKNLKTGQIVKVDAELSAWLISRKYAEPSVGEKKEPAAKADKK